MTNRSELPGGTPSAAEARIAEIRQLFTDIRDMIALQITLAGEVTSASPKSLISKVNELQSVQVLLLKAEEAFHDKFDTANRHAGLDTGALRTDIGRRLDRIRAGLGSGALSETTDPR